MNPNYPIYIISKGRYESRHTAKSLDKMNMPYRIVVEPNEYDLYRKVIQPEKILVTPENFSELGRGSIPVRNWVWEHAKEAGRDRHWLLDDNIVGFERLNRNQRGRVTSGTIFKCAEDFVDRYENIALAGFEYRQFCGGSRRKKPPFRLNHRVYSCTLINTNIPHRWRGKFNEDTDLCLRVLKDGWVTMTFNCFLQNKIKTMTMSGGNTDTVYQGGDERREFAESLKRQHPDVVEVVRRYNRWHHQVNYKPFQLNSLIKKPDLILENRVNNYGMVLVKRIPKGEHDE